MDNIKNTSIKIAGNKTIFEWNALEKQIKSDIDNSNLWEEAFLYFENRINTRYLIPINSIKENDTCSGEGFSIVVILCSLIEALESFYQGKFYAESLILAETGNSIGAIQIAGTASAAQIPFFVTACDYTLIGEEFFAASAYLSQDPKLIGGVKGMDVLKVMIVGFIAIAIILRLFNDLGWINFDILNFLTVQ